MRVTDIYTHRFTCREKLDIVIGQSNADLVANIAVSMRLEQLMRWRQ
jgi:hypothetical protein